MGMKNLLVGSRKGLLHFAESNGAWKLHGHHFEGVPVVNAIYDERNDTLWASLEHGHWGGKLHTSKDMGKTWAELVPPKYPDNAVKDDNGTKASYEFTWTIAQGGADREETLYLGTNPGALFKTDDNGESFELVDSLWNHESRIPHWFGGGRDTPGYSSIFVDPRDSKKIVCGVSCGGVFVSEDEGKTWAARNKGLIADFLPDPHAEYGHDVHFMTYCQSQPDVWWQQNHCGIFVSRDAGHEWTNVSDENGAKFGWAIGAHETNPDVAWVVPAQSDENRSALKIGLAVARTENGGKTWDMLQKGLPTECVFDIVYRHAFENKGDHLVFGTTTGNLYESKDGGDSWSCLGNNLAPVSSVSLC